jgi:hypothetical protein
MTVTGTDTPSSLKIRVIPLFLPINPIAIGLFLPVGDYNGVRTLAPLSSFLEEEDQSPARACRQLPIGAFWCQTIKSCLAPSERDSFNSIQTNLYFHPGRKIELHQRVYGFFRGFYDIQESLMGSDFVLVPCVFVDVWGH